MKTKKTLFAILGVCVATSAAIPAHAGWSIKKPLGGGLKIPNPVRVIVPIPVVPDIVTKNLPEPIKERVQQIEKEIKKYDPTPDVRVGGERFIDVQPNTVSEQHYNQLLAKPVLKMMERNRVIIEKITRLNDNIRTAWVSDYIAKREEEKARKEQEKAFRDFVEAEKRRQEKELSEEEAVLRKDLLENANLRFQIADKVVKQISGSRDFDAGFGQMLNLEITNRQLQTKVYKVAAAQDTLRMTLATYLSKEAGSAAIEGLYAEYAATPESDRHAFIQSLLDVASYPELVQLKAQRATYRNVMNKAAADECTEGVAALDALEIAGQTPAEAADFRKVCDGGL